MHLERQYPNYIRSTKLLKKLQYLTKQKKENFDINLVIFLFFSFFLIGFNSVIPLTLTWMGN